MKHYIYLAVLLFVLACNSDRKEQDSSDLVDWKARTASIDHLDSLEFGRTYLSIYSQVYSHSEHTTHNLTSMASLRNTSPTDTIYLLRADYFDTKGTLLRTYFDKTVYLSPLETVEIIIDEIDEKGGTGSNFIIDWKIPQTASEPLFEGIMNSTMGQQGLSFTTQGKRIQ